MKLLKNPLKPTPGVSAPAAEIRLLRFVIALILVVATLWVLNKLLQKEILEKNKLEVGLLLGWLIAKSGTVIDWLFGGSESGARRADSMTAHATKDSPAEGGSGGGAGGKPDVMLAPGETAQAQGQSSGADTGDRSAPPAGYD